MTTTPYVPSPPSSTPAAQSTGTKKHVVAKTKGLVDFLSQMVKAQQAKNSAKNNTEQSTPVKATGLNEGLNDMAKTLDDIGSAVTSPPPDAKGLNQDILSKLTNKFSVLTQNGEPLSQDALAQFKADALKLLKDLGIDGDEAQKYLAAFTQNLGSAISNAQAVFLTASNNGLPVANANKGKDAQASAAAAQNVASMSLQKASATPANTGDNTKAGMGGLQADKSNNGLPAQPAPQQQTAAPPPPQNAQGDAKISAQAQATAPHTPQGDSGNNSNAGGGNGSGFNNPSSPAWAAVDGVKVSGATGTQSFTNFMSQTQNAPQLPQMVAVQIQRNLAANVNSFTMKLDPAELGALQIRMTFGKNGSIKTRLTADKPETLSLLKNDAPTLNRLLQQAGLNADESSLSFDLNQQNAEGRDDGYNASGIGARGTSSANNADDKNAIQTKIAVTAMGHISQDGVNIVV